VSSPTDPQPPAEPAVPAPPSTQEIPVVTPAVAAPQLPPHPGATTPAPVTGVQPTGPVGLVPGLPGPLPPLPPPAAPTTGPMAANGATAATPPPAAPAESLPDAGPAAAAQQTADPTVVWPDTLTTGPVPYSSEPASAPTSARRSARSPVLRDRRLLLTLGLVAASLVLLELGLFLRFGEESFWSDIPLWSAFATACAALGLAAAAPLLPAGRGPSAGTAWRIAAGGLVGLAVFWLLVVLPVVATDRGFLLTAALGCLGGALWPGPARKG
jgi:hypothetical protein